MKQQVIVLPDPAAVAEAAAQRLVGFLLEAQSVDSPVDVALTGGSLGIALLAQARANPLLDAIAWPDVRFWWGDERFLEASSLERNEVAARQALLDHLPVPPRGVYPIPARQPDLTLDQAAQQYQDLLRQLKVSFDLVLLGVGPDGHVASIFPGLEPIPADNPGHTLTNEPTVLPVRHSPKPPAERISLTLETINQAREVWLVAAGTAKASALAAVGRGEAVPAGRVQGRERTLWLVDAAAAGSLKP
ncbi:MAG: 6-phosphogluconolactonase [Bifidobacteriaceae bacterium]|jgi:6-phosphogluconolactonase|nr:6-phosphogluconolactonase [Bifidobacteriaceae bacterium]